MTIKDKVVSLELSKKRKILNKIREWVNVLEGKVLRDEARKTKEYIKEEMWQAYLRSSREGNSEIHVKTKMGEAYMIKSERFT